MFDTPTTSERILYPEIAPTQEGMLAVDDHHRLYYAEYGNPQGKAVVFLHGGPGGGSSPLHARLFHPKKYRIILFDQRGCGKSVPHASLHNNTTAHLVADMEVLRKHLKIQQWQVFGGSWGSTLALAYAVQHPNHVQALVLRGIFLGRRQEIDWLYQNGAGHLFPEAFDAYATIIEPEYRQALLQAYHHQLHGSNVLRSQQAAEAWTRWEKSVSQFIPDHTYTAQAENATYAKAFALIENHYFRNGCFMPEGYLLKQAARIAHIPTVIIHGRYDVVCPVRNAWDLHKVLPNSMLYVVKDTGHSFMEPGIMAALVAATNKFAT